MAKRKPNVTLTVVVWGDATKQDDEPAEVAECFVAGSIVRVDEESVTLAHETFHDGDTRNFLTIPRGMIRKISHKRLYIPEFEEAVAPKLRPAVKHTQPATKGRR